MSSAVLPEAQLDHRQPETDRVIVIAGGSQDIDLALDLREGIRQSGWDCEIVQRDVSDRTQVDKLVHEVLDCSHHVGILVSHAGVTRDRIIPRVCDEEWLAQ
jgi:NAD(P)-dependent dehydrogenase (short-subunit alcohol dehydrogenase family)